MERSQDERVGNRFSGYRRAELPKGQQVPPESDPGDNPDQGEKKQDYHRDDTVVVKKLERLMVKLEQLEKLQKTEAELVIRMDRLLEKLECSEHLQQDVFNNAPRLLEDNIERASLEENLKKWLGIARVSGKVLAIVAENLEMIMEAVMKIQREQAGEAAERAVTGEGEQLNLSALLSTINNVLHELSSEKK